jgi:hypothetical protein
VETGNTIRVLDIQNKTLCNACKAVVHPRQLGHDFTPQRSSPHGTNTTLVVASQAAPAVEFRRHLSKTTTSSTVDTTLTPRFRASSKSRPCRVVHPVKRRTFVLRQASRMWLDADSWSEICWITMRGLSRQVLI